ncbi:MAG: RNase adapter RapZ [Gammaproteobacteria bacterium]|nr:RNase adapter RapZ [Gammaproteobacteria bacterium]NNJ73305.1 RNase adapter RapZ [Enterobacterales bacterium]
MKVVILSGRSGSGKTIALQALEDHEFFCIDNLPLSMMLALIEKLEPAQEAIAVSIDARAVPGDLDDFSDIYKHLEASSHNIEVIYLDADDATLMKRFSETRRRHPLTQDGLSLREAITKESVLLDQIRLAADLNVDTSSLNVHQLRDLIKYRVKGDNTSLDLLFVSFGYKHGIPSDADFVFDARCLPNPYWDESLRKYTGRDEPVQSFLADQSRVQEFYWQIKVFLHTWLPRFEIDNRSYLTIGIGCTGGQHRSVYITEKLAEHFRQEHAKVTVRHRELDDKEH